MLHWNASRSELPTEVFLGKIFSSSLWNLRFRTQSVWMPHTGQQYALLNNVSSRTLNLLRKFRRAASVLHKGAPKEWRKERKKTNLLSEAHLAHLNASYPIFQMRYRILKISNPILHWRLVSRLKSEVLKSLFSDSVVKAFYLIVIVGRSQEVKAARFDRAIRRFNSCRLSWSF